MSVQYDQLLRGPTSKDRAEGFSLLWKSCYRKLLDFSRRRLPQLPLQAHEDAVQIAFLELWTEIEFRGHKWRPRKSRNLLYTMVKCRGVDQYRRYLTRSRPMVSDSGLGHTETETENELIEYADAHNQLARERLKRELDRQLTAVEECLGKLPERQKQIGLIVSTLVLETGVDELTPKAICELFLQRHGQEISEDAAESTVFRIREKLRQATGRTKPPKPSNDQTRRKQEK